MIVSGIVRFASPHYQLLRRSLHFAASLLAQLQREQERRRHAREQIQPDQLRAGTAIEFQRGQTRSGTEAAAGAAPPLPGQAAINQMMANAAAKAAALAAGTLNTGGAKRSKWDSSGK